MRRELCAYLQDILDATDDISVDTGGLTLDSFKVQAVGLFSTPLF